VGSSFLHHSFRCSLWVMTATVAILAAPTATLEAQQLPANAQPTNDVDNGRRSFTTYGCSACHGYSGHGGVGPRLATTSLSIAALMKYVRQPTGVMPRYATETQVSDAALTDIYAFLKSIPRPPDPKTIPLLQDK